MARQISACPSLNVRWDFDVGSPRGWKVHQQLEMGSSHKVYSYTRQLGGSCDLFWAVRSFASHLDCTTNSCLSFRFILYIGARIGRSTKLFISTKFECNKSRFCWNVWPSSTTGVRISCLYYTLSNGT